MSELVPVVVGMIQFLQAFEPRASVSHEPLFQPPPPNSLPLGPLHRAAHNTASGFIRASKAGARESASKSEVIVFWSLISEVTSHHCCLFS